MADKTWLTTRKDGEWTVVEERSHTAETRELLRVTLPEKVSVAEMEQFVSQILREVRANEHGPS